MSKIRNLTGQPLALYIEDEEVATIPSEGRVWLNANYHYVDQVEVNGYPIPVIETTGEPQIDGLPAPEDDTYLVVTGLVASSFPERNDLLSPARIVKSGKGCRALLTQAEQWKEPA